MILFESHYYNTRDHFRTAIRINDRRYWFDDRQEAREFCKAWNGKYPDPLDLILWSNNVESLSKPDYFMISKDPTI